jgi:hypothetical protein
MPTNYTVDVKGSKYLVVETAGFEKPQITVMLFI